MLKYILDEKIINFENLYNKLINFVYIIKILHKFYNLLFKFNTCIYSFNILKYNVGRYKNMAYEKRKRFLVNFFYYGIIIAVTFFSIKFFWKYLSPFVLAFVVAYVLKPLVNKINVWFKIKRSISAILCVTAFYAAAVGIITLIGFQLLVLIRNLFYALPEYYNQELAPIVTLWLDRFQEILINIDPDIKTTVEDFSVMLVENLGSSISAFSVGVIAKLSSLVTKIPSLLIKTLITVIASFFISVDYYNITYFIAKQLSTKQIFILYEAESYAKTALFQYIKSYSLIMIITFFEVGVGLMLLGVENAIIVALIIAVFDILPVLGSGGILIPWGIISIVSGNTFFGVGLFCLYLIITIIRNIIEPRIIGQQVGLNPLATLMAIFLGVRLMGFMGLFCFPISLVILKQLNDSGKIKLFK